MFLHLRRRAVRCWRSDQTSSCPCPLPTANAPASPPCTIVTCAGIVSCLAFAPTGDLLAAGTYSGSLGLYDPRTYEQLYVMKGHKGGLTQVLNVGPMKQHAAGPGRALIRP